MTGIDDVLAALELDEVAPGSFRARNMEAHGQVVYGGQILAQVVVAAARAAGGKDVRSVHTIFARGGRLDTGLEITVDTLNDGRAIGSSTVTVSQGDRTVSRSLVLTSVEEPDLVRHADAAPKVPAPEECPPAAHGNGWWELRIVDGVDLSDPGAVGPAELNVWTRAVGAPADPVIGQALLAYATDGFLIGTAMRPHEGVGQALAHRSLSTSVLSHTLTFHDPVNAGDWHLLAHESTYAGRGRAYGRAEVFTESGAMVASYVQESLLRANPNWDPSADQPGRY
ncbi:MAG TPA: acyl-CoA thioesterase domain-containing protein [Microthrixaceae bacterium]|nr:acyl-CoA thioesterase domain-containing protein [Microthrixaceae bacterium]